MKWEYHIEEMEMPEEKYEELKTKHLEKMNELGRQEWEYMMSIGPLFYFKRPLSIQIRMNIGRRLVDEKR